MRALALMNYGTLGFTDVPDASYPEWNLRWWLEELVQGVLKEEGFEGNNQCDCCFHTYGKDSVRRKTE